MALAVLTVGKNDVFSERDKMTYIQTPLARSVKRIVETNNDGVTEELVDLTVVLIPKSFVTASSLK